MKTISPVLNRQPKETFFGIRNCHGNDKTRLLRDFSFAITVVKSP